MTATGANAWIHRRPDAEVAAEAAAVDPSLELAGRTFAVKDNIDVAGLPTTAGCPAFSYLPDSSAPIVERLVAAGAIVAGKTNMDQFATGLTGARSPYGACTSVLDPDRISGGSSSGSAIAVAAGQVSFSLGTDTAGSGRVPAACNGIVGYKPAPGAWSTVGIVPACRTLDCPSLFTRTVADALRIAAVLTPASCSASGVEPRCIAAPDEASLTTLPPAALAAFEATVSGVRRAGLEVVRIDMAPFFAAGDLLYGGAWVAERYHAVGSFLESHPDDVHPVVASIIRGGRDLSAVQAFDDQYRLAAHREEAMARLAGVDALVVPTVPDVPTLAAVLESPIATNTALGRFTTFVNLLGLAALAVPAAGRSDGVPNGATVAVRAGDDAIAFHVGALIAGETTVASSPPSRSGGVLGDRVRLVVVGAHLQGQPLNHQLTDRGATLVASTSTASAYRLHALDTELPKPGLERVDIGGAAIEVEVWSLGLAEFGSFVAADVPPPLAIGKIELANGEWLPGFVCEKVALHGARDITAFGGWRAFRSAVVA